MKKSNLLLTLRWITGLLFIFSGLIKANDPLGLSYKMQEFFQAWGWAGWEPYTLTLSFVMNVFEVVAGVAVIVGWRMRIFSWLLLLLIIFFGFLTGYAWLSGKIHTCGCFGDCLPITPATSFFKDIFLLVLISILHANRQRIVPSLREQTSRSILLTSLVATVVLQWYVLARLPLIDCLPYRKGNDILQQMQSPPNAIQDSFSIVFRYKKAGKTYDFDATSLPADLDGYEYVDRTQKLVRQGNATPPIPLFTLTTADGNDISTQLLGSKMNYVLIFVLSFDHYNDFRKDILKAAGDAASWHAPVFIVTPRADQAAALLGKSAAILSCDATVVKTAARHIPTYFLMQGSRIVDKAPGPWLKSR